MYKVLIADDELLVRVGLKSTIDWEGNGFYVVGEARNGSEAIEMFDREKPDILITDVSMPNMNGLELIAHLKEKNNKLKSIILTHYDNFDYAREAINLGVIGYLLKTDLTQENLLAYLKKAVDSLGPTSCENHFDGSREILKTVLSGKVIDLEQRKEVQRWYSNEENFSVVTVVFYAEKTDSVFPEKELVNLDKLVANLSRQIFTGRQMNAVPLLMDKKVVYIVDIKNSVEKGTVENILKEKMLLIKTNLKNYLNLNLTIGIGSPVMDIDDIHKSFAHSLHAVERSFFEENSIAVYDPSSPIEQTDRVSVDMERLNTLIEQHGVRELTEYVDAVFEELKDNKDMDLLHETVILMLDNARTLLGTRLLGKSSLAGEGEYARDVIDNFHNINSLKQYVCDMYSEIINSGNEEQGEGDNSFIIQKSIDYIKKHYAENISLMTVAKHVEVSRSYLSFLFKQELGINFSSYMTEIRMENAKELLLTSNMKIYEIAEEVGFDSPYYFSKIFKEKTGLTCKTFRNKYYKSHKDGIYDE